MSLSLEHRLLPVVVVYANAIEKDLTYGDSFTLDLHVTAKVLPSGEHAAISVAGGQSPKPHFSFHAKAMFPGLEVSFCWSIPAQHRTVLEDEVCSDVPMSPSKTVYLRAALWSQALSAQHLPALSPFGVSDGHPSVNALCAFCSFLFSPS